MLIVLGALSAALAFQTPSATVSGAVRDARGGDPLSGAVVSLPDLHRFAITDADGRYELRGVPVGPQRLTIRFIGHVPRTLRALVPAAGELLVILFTTEQDSGHVVVRLTDGSDVVVRAPSDAASFTSAEGRLVIENRSRGAVFDIDIPRSAPRVEIRVGGQRAFLKDGASISAPVIDRRPGQFVLSLSRR